MKKHKSVVAILLAVMMIFTMMPAMVFADGNPVKSWEGDTYETAIDSSGARFSTTRTFNAETGLITAVPAAKASTVEGEAPVPAPEGTAMFYDLTGSSLVYGNDHKALNGSSWTQAAFGGQTLYVELVEPSYAYSKEAKENPNYKPQKAYVEVSNLKATFDTWTLELEMSEYKEGIETDQTVDFTVKSLAPSGTIDGVTTADLTGTVAKATATVKGVAKTPDTASFYLDSVGGVAYDKGIYDGATHTVVADAVPGYTVSYQVLNPATGKYADVSAVTITDVQKTAVQFKAIFTDAKGVATAKGPFSLNLAPLASKRGVRIGWDSKASAADEGYLYLVDGTEYNANDFIAVDVQQADPQSGETPAQAAERVALNNAAKNAVAVNDAQLKDFFNTYYELKDVTTKAAAADDQVLFMIAPKTLSEAEQKAATEKFAQLRANFGYIYVDTYYDPTATIQLNADKIDYEIEFTKAPEGAKVIHVKKAKKLKANKSFTVAAVSNKGVAVQYKLINANSKIKINKTTGKITLKKGLKKGTYKFKVKAYVPGHSTYAYEIQNITVKIKK